MQTWVGVTELMPRSSTKKWEITLPEGVEFSCPSCGEAVERGQKCQASIKIFSDMDSIRTGYSARLVVDCRCGAKDVPPAVVKRD